MNILKFIDLETFDLEIYLAFLSSYLPLYP